MKKPSKILQEKEWIQNRMFCYRYIYRITGCCMLGAWNLAFNKATKEEQNILTDAMNKILKNLGIPVSYWNDMPERTKKECIAKFQEFHM